MALKDIFALAGTISVDSSGAIDNIDKATDAAKRSESKFESSFKNIARAAVTYLSATAIWNFGKSMVEAAAEVQAETAQFDAAFKDLSGSATEAFGRLEESTGTLATRLQVSGTKAFSQFKGAGLESAEALGEMERYLKLATDGAAYYDLTLEETDELLRSFIRGNTEAGDRLGLFTSETQRNEKALEKHGKKFLELTEAQKQMLMLDISEEIYKNSGAVGQAARESEGYANVVGNLKEQWRQFLAQVGAPVLQAVIPILQSLGDVFKAITPFVKGLTTTLVEHKDVIVAIIAGVGAAAAAYGAYKIVLAAVNTYEKISNALKTAGVIAKALYTSATLAEAKATAKATLAQKGLNIAMLGSPITWIVVGIAALVAAFVLLWKKCEGFRNFWKQMWDKIKSIASQAWSAIKKVWDQVKPYFTALWNAVKNAAKAAWDLIKKVWDKVKPYFKVIFDFIKTIAKSAMDRVKFIFSLAWEGVKLIWNNAKAYFKMVFNTITGIFNVIAKVLKGDFKGAWEGIKGIFKGVGKFFKEIVNNIVNAFSNIGQKIANKFKGLGGKIKSAAGKAWGGIKKLVGFKTGGVFTGESAIRVAEYPNATTNPEIVTPQRIMRDTFADTLENYNLRASDGAGSSRVEALLEKLIALFGQQKVVLSTGELVGALTPRMDKALGDRSVKKERGRV